jgi:hypothetical protein
MSLTEMVDQALSRQRAEESRRMTAQSRLESICECVRMAVWDRDGKNYHPSEVPVVMFTRRMWEVVLDLAQATHEGVWDDEVHTPLAEELESRGSGVGPDWRKFEWVVDEEQGTMDLSNSVVFEDKEGTFVVRLQGKDLDECSVIKISPDDEDPVDFGTVPLSDLAKVLGKALR